MDYFKKLPEEISLDILTRLPIESVLDSKLVCRNWRSVVAHPSFSKMHFHHHLNHPAAESAGKLGFLVLTFSRISGDRSHYFGYNQIHDQSTNPIQRITRINFTFPFKYFVIVGSCNGLICILPQSPKHPCFYICNPIIRECVMVPEIKRDSDTHGYDYENSGFGYVSSTNEYKIVRFYKSKTHLEVHIYTLGSGNGWRNLGRFNYGSSQYLHKVFFANEALYWMDHELKMIGTFNLAEEKFCQHLSPPPLPPDTHRFRCRMGVLDGFLFHALDDQRDGLSDIWLLKEMEDMSLGWNNELRIKDMDSMDLLAVTKSDGVLTKRDYFCINIYDTQTSTSKSLVKFKSFITQVCRHKNTLVSLKELGEQAVEVMESVQIEETKSGEQPQHDADPEYIIYL